VEVNPSDLLRSGEKPNVTASESSKKVKASQALNKTVVEEDVSSK